MTTVATILHIDDDDANRYAVSRALRKAGFNVIEGATGSEALTHARNLPDLVILDVRLPDINGFEVCRRLKSDPLTSSLPVLHLSASYTTGEDKAMGLDAGADAYLFRPVQPVELIATINALLRQKRAEAALVRANDALRRSEERFRFLSDLGESTRHLNDPMAVMEAVERRLGEQLRANRCVYAEVDPDSEHFSVRHDYTNGCASVVGEWALSDFGQRVQSDMLAGRTLVIHDVDREISEPAAVERFRAIQIGAVVCCPLRREGRLVAMMAVQMMQPRTWAAEDVALVEAVVERSWSYIERARTHRALAESEERFRRLVREVTDYAILTFDGAGRITSFNPGAEALFGYAAHDVLGRPGAMLFTQEDQQAGVPAQELLSAATNGRVPDVRWHQRADGSRRFVNGICTALYDETGKVIGYAKIGRDETDRQLADEVNARLAAMVRASRDAIFMLDPAGLIRSWNPAAQQMFGVGPEDIIGRPIHQLLTREHAAETLALFEKACAGEAVEYAETICCRADGQSVEVEMSLSPIRDREGKLSALAATIRDIGERRRTEQERRRLLQQERQAREEAETANRVKDEFLATLSHELRTPLNAIVGWASVLATVNKKAVAGGTPVPGELTEGLDAINRNARVQAQLIEDLLDVSRIISGKLRLEVKRVELSPIVEAAIASVLPAAQNKQIRIDREIAATATSIWGDAARLQQVIWNLLSNAIKFTPAGGKVSISVRRIDSTVELTVTDSGRGIRPEFIPYVFERFRQADASTTRTQGGLGLGLAIVKHLVEQHGGTVSAASEGDGKGATFTVRLPQSNSVDLEPTPAPAAAPAPAVVRPAGPPLAGLKILAIDDEADARNLLKRFLERCGASVTAADSVAEAMTALRSERFDLVISDIGMPHEDGYVLIKKLRALPEEEGGQTPAIALTAFARAEDKQRCLQAGFHVHVAKPIEPDELMDVVEAVTRSG
jgi:PAS domain S-box-containing protein